MVFSVAMLGVLGVALAICATILRAQSAPAGARHVVVISIDGLKPATYTRPGAARIPTLRRLAQEGAWAEGVVGVLPAVHGIPNNLIFDPEGQANGEWYRFAQDIKAPTLPGVVKGLGLSTGAVSWPVSAGMNVDYLLPEFGYYKHPQMLALMRLISERGTSSMRTSTRRAAPWPGR